MKRLTINHIAGAGLRAHKRQYVSLVIGIFLSIFMVCSLCIAVQGVVLAGRAKVTARVGQEDGFALDEDVSDETLMQSGLFERVGNVYVTANIKDSQCYIGYYDDSGDELLSRRCAEGRLPERAGEIAMERLALEQLRIECAVGDKVSLELLPIDGVAAETRAFTLVGILTEQSAYLDVTSFSNAPGQVLKFPSALIAPDESPLARGRIVTHKLVTYAPLVTYDMVDQYTREHTNSLFYGLDASGNIHFFTVNYLSSFMTNISETLMIFILLGGSLVLAACVGISGAMEGQIARKREEIGMLRAVGATRRQIRRIFGREAWLIAFLVSPVAIAAACLFVWGLSRFASDVIVFAPTPLLLVPALLLSVVTVLLAASLPLRRAGRTQPMSVLRDTALIRRQKHIKSKKAFNVPRLIATRQTRLYPSRMIGSSLLVALMMFFVSGFAQILMTDYSDIFINRADFQIESASFGWSYANVFAEQFKRTTLTDQDISQIRALPMVERADIERALSVNAVLPRVTQYIKPLDSRNWDNQYLMSDEEKAADAFYEERYNVNYRAAKDALQVSGDMAQLPLQVVAVDAEALAPYVTQGRINMEALNNGTEVLVVAPDVWVKQTTDSDGVTTQTLLEKPANGDYTYELLNDMFFAGETLPLIQTFSFEGDDPDFGGISGDYDDTFRQYGAYERRDASPVIGAVLGGRAPLDWIYYDDISIVTTEQGLKAMGLYAGSLDQVDIYLSAVPDADTESYLQGRLESIAMRGDNMTVYNKLAQQRENDASKIRSVVTLGSVVMLFFAVSVALVVGNATRRVQADKRAIGTLRAVGADRRDILQCYAGQAIMSILIGAVVGIAFSLCYLLRMEYSRRYWDEALLFEIAFLALILLCSVTLLRARIKTVVRQSIVDNIREL